MGEMLQKVLHSKLKTEALFYHGGMSIGARGKAIDEFEKDPERRVLILSLKAGGTGLNLTAASQVIHYDLWWNPAVEAQATDRAYRIGQNRRVIVHRLITKDTFEEKINDILESKKKISEMTVATGENWITKMSDDELREVFTLGKN
jgi:SNF2 family DNA or RNA helicase